MLITIFTGLVQVTLASTVVLAAVDTTTQLVTTIVTAI